MMQMNPFPKAPAPSVASSIFEVPKYLENKSHDEAIADLEHQLSHTSDGQEKNHLLHHLYVMSTDMGFPRWRMTQPAEDLPNLFGRLTKLISHEDLSAFDKDQQEGIRNHNFEQIHNLQGFLQGKPIEHQKLTEALDFISIRINDAKSNLENFLDDTSKSAGNRRSLWKKRLADYRLLRTYFLDRALR